MSTHITFLDRQVGQISWTQKADSEVFCRVGGPVVWLRTVGTETMMVATATAGRTMGKTGAGAAAGPTTSSRQHEALWRWSSPSSAAVPSPAVVGGGGCTVPVFAESISKPFRKAAGSHFHF
jgi:hypothetical protein